MDTDFKENIHNNFEFIFGSLQDALSWEKHFFNSQSNKLDNANEVIFVDVPASFILFKFDIKSFNTEFSLSDN